MHHGNSHVRQGNPALPGHRQARGRQAQPRHRGRRVPRPRRPLRLRQVHLPAHARRPRGGQRRHASCIGDRDVTDLSAQGPRHRDGLPELRALPAHDRRRQHGLRAQDRRRRQGRDRASASRRPPRSSTSSRTSTASRRPSPVASASASPWAARSCASPQVFLMDEPLSNLDAKLRVQTRTQIASLQRRLGVTTVYVTHDQVEAMTMGDRVAVLKDGLLQQVDTPRALYDHPDNVFVAGFIGSPAMNLLERRVDRRRRQVRRRASTRSSATRLARRTASTSPLGVRPEDLEHRHRRRRACRSTVDVVEELGADAYIYGSHQRSTGDATHRPDRRPRRRPPPPEKGETRLPGPRARATCTCSTPRPACASATDAVRRRPGASAVPDRGRRQPPAVRRGRPRRRRRRPGRRSTAAGRRRCQRWSRGTRDHRRAARPRPARPAVATPAGGLAGGRPRRAPPRHLPARRPLRHSCRGRVIAVKEIKDDLARREYQHAAAAAAARRALRRAGRRHHRPHRPRTASRSTPAWSPGTCSSRCPTARCSARRCARTPRPG